MELTNLNKLKIDNSDLYDLIMLTYKHDPTIPYMEYTIMRDEEMRIDLICNSIYNSDKYTEYLMDYNNIDNPLNFKGGDVIRYISLDYIERTVVAVREEIYEEKRKLSVLNNIDASRDEYVANNNSLTPTSKRVPSKAVTIEGNIIKVGGNNE